MAIPEYMKEKGAESRESSIIITAEIEISGKRIGIKTSSQMLKASNNTQGSIVKLKVKMAEEAEMNPIGFTIIRGLIDPLIITYLKMLISTTYRWLREKEMENSQASMV